MTLNRTNLFACSIALGLGLSGVACGDDPPASDGMGGTGGDTTDGVGTGGTDGGTGGTGGGTGGTGMGGIGGAPVELADIDEVVAKNVDIAANLYGVSFTDDGLIYVVGDTLVDTDDAAIVLARYTADGELDTDFGTDGVRTINSIEKADDAGADTPGFEESTSVAAMPDGGAVVLINRNNGLGGNRVQLVRVDDEGVDNPLFGTNGYLDLDMGPGAAATFNDTAYDVLLDTSGTEDRLVIFGRAPAPTSTPPRTDMDRYIVRVMASDGSPDTSFSDDGIFSIDTGDKEMDDTSRRGLVLDDGSVVSAGYTNLEEMDRHHIYLIKLDAEGAPDDTFGFFDADSSCGTEQEGVLCINPFIKAGEMESDTVKGGFAEAYAVAMQDGQPITTGYGQVDVATSNYDVVSFRFDADSLDSSYATAGALVVDSGSEDRGRDLDVLEDGRLVHVGKHDGQAAVYVTDAEGTLWDGFGTSGIQSYAAHDGNLMGVATRDGVIAAVGESAKGTGSEAFLVILKVAE